MFLKKTQTSLHLQTDNLRSVAVCSPTPAQQRLEWNVQFGGAAVGKMRNWRDPNENFREPCRAGGNVLCGKAGGNGLAWGNRKKWDEMVGFFTLQMIAAKEKLNYTQSPLWLGKGRLTIQMDLFEAYLYCFSKITWAADDRSGCVSSRVDIISP